LSLLHEIENEQVKNSTKLQSKFYVDLSLIHCSYVPDKKLGSTFS